MTIIEKINDLGYEIKPDGGKIWHTKMEALTICKNGATEAVNISNTVSPIAIGCGRCGSLEVAREKVAQGIGLITTGAEIYRSYYAEGKTDREWALLNVCYSERSYDALEGEKQRLHFVRAECEEDGAYLTLENADPIAVGWNEGQLGQVVGKSEWCLQYSKQYDVDAFATHYYLFDQKPSREDALHAATLESIRNNLGTSKLPEMYTCWECGHECFWLDNGGSDIYECAARATDKYCGC